jgi:hypothetical protein
LRLTKEFYLSLLFAFIAMVFVVLIDLFTPAPTTPVPLDDKLVVSAFFIVSCCVGMSLALYPGWFRQRATIHVMTREQVNGPPSRAFSGHHPDCSRFDAHRITIGARTWCAGCLGLVVGALGSIVLMALYVAASPAIPRFGSQLLFLLGFVCVIIVFIETLVKNRRPTPHLFFNVALIVGFSLITMSITELSGKGLFGVLAVLLCAVMLSTRVTLSSWRHQRTCDSCTASCKMYDASSASRRPVAQR